MTTTNSSEDAPNREVVQRGKKRLSRFAPEPRAVIPPGSGGGNDMLSTDELIDDRIRTLMSRDRDRTMVPHDDLGEIAATTGDNLIDAFLRVQAVDAGRGR